MKKTIFFILLLNTMLYSEDWPVYKGNLYFTGNNDEIVVKTPYLKWLFQANQQIFNPIASDGKIYFIGIEGFIYCVDSDYGRLIWKIDLRKISSNFRKTDVRYKIKYPLIKNNLLLITDGVSIYAIDKNNGAFVWARAGIETDTKNFKNINYKPIISGIYSDPVIVDNFVFYGTRDNFLTRNLENGHLKWDTKLSSYDAFPSFYDNIVFTQSRDYKNNEYKIIALSAKDGSTLWAASLEKPFKIYPPVTYKGSVFIPVSDTLHSLNIKDGSLKWKNSYGGIITSPLSFTDRSIIFSINNQDILIVEPENGQIKDTIKVKEKSSPYFVTIRDIIYVAYNEFISEFPTPYTIVKAIDLDTKNILWEFKSVFPGAVSQPSAYRGNLIVASGNYLYSIGATGYKRIVDGGDGYNVDTNKEKEISIEEERKNIKIEEEKKSKEREITLDAKDEKGKEIEAYVDVIKRDENGNIIYQKKQKVVDKKIKVPDTDGVEVIVSSDGFLPEKVIIDKKDEKKEVVLKKIEINKIYIVENINFDFNSAHLKKESLDILSKILDIMKSNPNLKLLVMGHTDSIGDDKYNQKLSERRADAVIEYLIKNGISPERLSSEGYGETKPVASNDTEEGRAKNRRTEFKFYY
ncbi:MAG TPA: OmpA family protein [Spirochaetota bacterium]|nr:OmpA family protein [Spirochaetota bacterium]HOM38688.1 OmpA family protein [Spirochaetota bacterium]HPQ49796.1 OmpA family protein [Spirochaetota bacterium]